MLSVIITLPFSHFLVENYFHVQATETCKTLFPDFQFVDLLNSFFMVFNAQLILQNLSFIIFSYLNWLGLSGHWVEGFSLCHHTAAANLQRILDMLKLGL